LRIDLLRPNDNVLVPCFDYTMFSFIVMFFYVLIANPVRRLDVAIRSPVLIVPTAVQFAAAKGETDSHAHCAAVSDEGALRMRHTPCG
jgi:hypothetical protein